MKTAEEKHTEDIPAFEALIKKGATDPFPYDRLMIHYRKTKEYSKELQVIDKAIKVFQAQLEKLQNKAFARSKKRSTIRKLSTAINKSSGLIDNKGKATFIPEPIARWLKRKTIVKKKIASA